MIFSKVAANSVPVASSTNIATNGSRPSNVRAISRLFQIASAHGTFSGSGTGGTGRTRYQTSPVRTSASRSRQSHHGRDSSSLAPIVSGGP